MWCGGEPGLETSEWIDLKLCQGGSWSVFVGMHGTSVMLKIRSDKQTLTQCKQCLRLLPEHAACKWILHFSAAV